MDKRLVWLSLGAFAISTVGFVFSSLLPSIAADAHVSIPHAGHLITAFSLSYAIFTPLLSALAGSIDRRLMIVAAMLVFVAGNVAAASSSSFELLLAAQIVMGMSAGLFAATAQATVPTRLLILYRSHFEDLVAGDRAIALVVARNLLRLLAGYVRAANLTRAKAEAAAIPPAIADAPATPATR